MIPDWDLLIDIMKGKVVKAQTYDYTENIQKVEKDLPNHPKEY